MGAHNDRLVRALFAIAIAKLLALLLVSDATAEETPKASQCVLAGISAPPVGLQVYDRAQAGRAIAHFNGVASALKLSEFPADPTRRRAKIETGIGAGNFRISGWVDARKFSLFATERLPVVSGHVWLEAHRALSAVGASGSRLRVQKTLTAPFQQTFTAWSSCQTLTFKEGSAPAPSVPGEARAYVLEKASLEIFDRAAGSRVMTLQRASTGNGVLFFSTERRGDWLYIEHHGDVVIDAWAKARDMRALPLGETMDQLPSTPLSKKVLQVKIAGKPRVLKTTKDVPLRLSADDTAEPVGVIEPGTETYVLDIVMGWASVLPVHLNIAPEPDDQFWAKAQDLGL